MVSVLEFLPKLLIVSIQTTGNINKFIIGINNKTIHQAGLFIIFINTTKNIKNKFTSYYK